MQKQIIHKAELDPDLVRALAGMTLGGGLGYMFGPRKRRLLSGLMGAGAGAGAGYLASRIDVPHNPFRPPDVPPAIRALDVGSNVILGGLGIKSLIQGGARLWKARAAAAAARAATGAAGSTAAQTAGKAGAGRLLAGAGTRLGALGTGTAAVPAAVIMAAMQAAKGVLDPDRSLQAVRNLDPSSKDFQLRNLWRAVDPRNVGAALQMGFEAGVRPVVSAGQNYLTKIRMDALKKGKEARGF